MSKLPLPHRAGPVVEVPEVPFHSLLWQLWEAHGEVDPKRHAIVSRVLIIEHHYRNFRSTAIDPTSQVSPTLSSSRNVEVWLDFCTRLECSSDNMWLQSRCRHHSTSWSPSPQQAVDKSRLPLLCSLQLAANALILTGLNYRATLAEARHQLSNSESELLITNCATYRRFAPLYADLRIKVLAKSSCADRVVVFRPSSSSMAHRQLALKLHFPVNTKSTTSTRSSLRPSRSLKLSESRVKAAAS